jgi:hypothetical protein
VTGVFELFSDRAYAFAERDITALERLAEMIQTALHHANAAERAERIIGQVASANKVVANKEAPDPIKGEARARPVVGEIESKPEPVGSKISENVAQPKSSLKTDDEKPVEPRIVLPTERGNIGSCQSCGFPVSEGRKLCLDCESSSASHGANVAPFLSSIAIPRENWLRSHQYLIGMLLVAALTIAVLVWMR